MLGRSDKAFHLLTRGEPSGLGDEIIMGEGPSGAGDYGRDCKRVVGRCC